MNNLYKYIICDFSMKNMIIFLFLVYLKKGNVVQVMNIIVKQRAD